MANMQAAAQVLGTLDVRKRQLSSSQRRALSRAGCLSTVYLAALVLCALPFLVVGAYGVYVAVTENSDASVIAMLILVILSPLLVFVLFGAGGLGWLRRTRRKLEAACAATPPQRPGEPARCHLCGAPIQTSETAAIARCSYCAADNLVAPDTLARAASRQAQVMDGFETEVNRRGTAASSVGVGVIIALPVAAVASPIIAVVALFVILLTLVHVEGPVDPSIRYVLAETSHGRCVAQYRPSAPESERVDLGSWAGDEPGKMASGTKPFDASWLNGKSVTLPEFGGGQHQVMHTFSPPLIKANYARLSRERDGELVRLELMNGLCLVD